MTNSIGVVQQRDQLEMESTVETEEQRQIRREQTCVNLERQNAERREDRSGVLADRLGEVCTHYGAGAVKVQTKLERESAHRREQSKGTTN